MRAPGEAQGNFAVESAIDELSYKLGMDPLDLRLRNYAEVQPQLGLPWSSKALRECYTVGAERFGWSRRDPEVGSMRDGHWQVGYGMAGVTYDWWQMRCEARITISRDGTAFVRSAATDIGTGTYTVMKQLVGRTAGPRTGPGPVRPRRLGHAVVPHGRRIGAHRRAGQRRVRGQPGPAGRSSSTPSQATSTRHCAAAPLDDVTVTGGRVHRKTDMRDGARPTPRS